MLRRSIQFTIFIFVMASVFACVGPSLQAFEPQGTLRGQIYDEGGAVFPRVLISIHRWYNGEPLSEIRLRTDNNGQFRQDLAPGLYDVYISSPVSKPIAKKIEIRAGQNTTLEEQLKLSELARFIE